MKVRYVYENGNVIWTLNAVDQTAVPDQPEIKRVYYTVQTSAEYWITYLWICLWKYENMKIILVTIQYICKIICEIQFRALRARANQTRHFSSRGQCKKKYRRRHKVKHTIFKLCTLCLNGERPLGNWRKLLTALPFRLGVRTSGRWCVLGVYS